MPCPKYGDGEIDVVSCADTPYSVHRADRNFGQGGNCRTKGGRMSFLLFAANYSSLSNSHEYYSVHRLPTLGVRSSSPSLRILQPNPSPCPNLLLTLCPLTCRTSSCLPVSQASLDLHQSRSKCRRQKNSPTPKYRATRRKKTSMSSSTTKSTMPRASLMSIRTSHPKPPDSRSPLSIPCLASNARHNYPSPNMPKQIHFCRKDHSDN
jgi:hypothetical protein